jgi:hypothetical protein
MIGNSANLQRYSLHGAAIGITSMVKGLAPELGHLLGDFRVPNWPAGSLPISGMVWPYERSHVLKCMSPTAKRVENGVGSRDDLLELYEDDERFWLVDDRWGISEINLIKGQWRSWVLPAPQVDTVRVAQMAVMWPLAQLLRARGLYLVPAASVAFGDRSFLMLSPFGLEPELMTLIRAGYRIIGQSWTAIREHEGRFSMMNLPGYVERALPPGMRLTTNGSVPSTPTWVDLMHEFCGAELGHGWCDAVLIIDAVRRGQTNVRPLDRGFAVQILKAAWPIFELHPNRRHGQLPARMGRSVPSFQISLSREPRDLLSLLATLPTPASHAVIRPQRLRAAG